MSQALWICAAVLAVMTIALVILESTARMNLEKHVHVWMSKTKGHGEPPKQNLPEPVGIRGFLGKCACGVRMFIPDDPRLKPEEIE